MSLNFSLASFKKSIVLGAMALIFFISFGTVAAKAATVNTGGGVWSYGVGNYVWSNYYHGYRYHSSAVSGTYFASSGSTAPGYTARASAPSAMWGNRTYYNYW
ncbi:lactococcin 972 family bacteriocin [Fructilactobacillus frigidiflavus]|uniref:lactococcin 972 family bacteriocin n=1 Tax=Fructilactobacillus frigidiflavus TaxID=3242688 RepID=UPI003757DD7C